MLDQYDVAVDGVIDAYMLEQYVGAGDVDGDVYIMPDVASI